MSHMMRGRGKRLTPDLVAEIRRLKAAGCTQMEIKRITGISRTTIHLVVNGRRIAEKPPAEPEEEANPYFDGPVERCPRCGRKVYMPCMACRVDSMLETGLTPSSPIQVHDRRQIGGRW